MAKIYTQILLLMFMVFSFYGHSQIVINEIFPQTNKVEIKNLGASMVPIANWELCRFPDYDDLGSLATDCGSTNLQPGQLLVVTVGWNISGADDEMGLYIDDSFGSSASIRDYVEWGSSGHARAGVATGAGIWTNGDFAPGFPNTSSLEYDGAGDSSTDWSPASPNSLCSENGGGGPSCSLTSTGLSGISCDDNGTPADASDDFISFTLNPTGTDIGAGYTVSVSGGTINPTNGNYGNNTNFELNAGSAGNGNVTVTVTDNTDGTCTTNSLIIDPGACSASCNLASSGLNSIDCDNNGSPSDDTDDIVIFNLIPDGSDLGAGYNVSSSAGTITPNSGNYGIMTSFELDAGSAGGGNVTVTITDQNDPSCTIDVIVTDPGACSFSCDLTTAGLNSISCDDNNTSSDDTDDAILFNLNPSGVNLSAGYNVSASSGPVTPNSGNYGGNTSFELSAGSAGGGNVTVTITDQNEPACSIDVIVSDPGTCSSSCIITSIGLTNLSCNDNGTPSDPLDDYNEFNLNPTGSNLGSGYAVSVAGQMASPMTGNYGSATAFRLADGSASMGVTVSITVTDNNDNACSREEVATNTGSCSPDCVILSENLSGITCMDSGTDADPSDDVIRFTLNPTGNNRGAGYNVTVNSGTVNPTSATYGSETMFTLQTGSAGGGDVVVTITDTDDATCSSMVTVSDPGTCSGTCNIMSSGLTEVQCIDNMTDDDSTDDFISFLLNPQGSNLSASYTVSVSSGTITPTMASYGGDMPFRFQNGSAGAGNVTVTIMDVDNPGCTLEQVVMDPGSCSNNACAVMGGNIATADNLNVCTGDDIESIINLTVENEVGSNGVWIIYGQNAINTILAISDDPQFNIDEIDCFQCLVVFVSYEDGLTGLTLGSPYFAIDGCFDASNTLQITQLMAMGGLVSTTDNTSICLSDGASHIVGMGHTGSGNNYAFVLTDDADMVQQEVPANIDFDNFAVGDYRVYGVAYDANLVLGSTINDLTADNCLDVSDNFVEVSVRTGADCIVANRNQVIDRALNVFPNPSSDRVHIELKDTPYEMELVKIIDATGKEVKNQSIRSTRGVIELDHLANGLYHIQVLIDQNYYYRKVVVVQ